MLIIKICTYFKNNGHGIRSIFIVIFWRLVGFGKFQLSSNKLTSNIIIVLSARRIFYGSTVRYRNMDEKCLLPTSRGDVNHIVDFATTQFCESNMKGDKGKKFMKMFYKYLFMSYYRILLNWTKMEQRRMVQMFSTS